MLNSGARTKWSTIFDGIWRLVFEVALPFVLSYVPSAALGPLLVYKEAKRINCKQIRSLSEISRSETFIYFTTMITIVCQDLLFGLMVGIMLTVVKLVYRFTHRALDLETNGRVSHLQLLGAATFLCLPSLARALDEVPQAAELHIHIENLTDIEHACHDLIRDWPKEYEYTGGKLVLDWDRLRNRFKADPAVEAMAVLSSRSYRGKPVRKDENASRSLSS
ncbi:MAG: SulP family inorganic anion transporter [Mariniblastus sp.]|nr:SulP family inorganic anion transporter [Mariniblastus sp.]